MANIYIHLKVPRNSPVIQKLAFAVLMKYRIFDIHYIDRSNRLEKIWQGEIPRAVKIFAEDPHDISLFSITNTIVR